MDSIMRCLALVHIRRRYPLTGTFAGPSGLLGYDTINRSVNQSINQSIDSVNLKYSKRKETKKTSYHVSKSRYSRSDFKIPEPYDLDAFSSPSREVLPFEAKGLPRSVSHFP